MLEVNKLLNYVDNTTESTVAILHQLKNMNGSDNTDLIPIKYINQLEEYTILLDTIKDIVLNGELSEEIKSYDILKHNVLGAIEQRGWKKNTNIYLSMEELREISGATQLAILNVIDVLVKEGHISLNKKVSKEGRNYFTYNLLNK